MDVLQKKCKAQGRLIGICVLAVGLILFLIWGLKGLGYFTSKTITPNMDLSRYEGKIVTVEVQNALDYYEYWGNSESSAKFQSWLCFQEGTDKGDGNYFGVTLEAKKKADMEKLTDDWWAWLNDEKTERPAGFTVTGVVAPMDATDKGYFNEYIDKLAEYGMDADRAYFHIIDGYVDAKMKNSITKELIFDVISGVLVVVGIVLIVLAGAGWDKKIQNYVVMHMHVTREMLNADAKNGMYFADGNIIVGKEAIYFSGTKAGIAELKTQCWGYYFHQGGRYPRNEIRLFDTAGKMTVINCQRRDGDAVLAYMGKTFPWMVVGYKSQWENMFKTSRDEFLRLTYYEGRQKYAGDEVTSAGATSYQDPWADMPEMMTEPEKKPEQPKPSEPVYDAPWADPFAKKNTDDSGENGEV